MLKDKMQNKSLKLKISYGSESAVANNKSINGGDILMLLCFAIRIQIWIASKAI